MKTSTHGFFYTKTATLHPADMAAIDFKLQEFYNDDWEHFLMSVIITIDIFSVWRKLLPAFLG
jgi:hypothetical protein